MNKLWLFPGLIFLLFCVGCGNGNGGGGPIPPPAGNFSNASLNGQYAYQLIGIEITQVLADFREAGVFTANGNGMITGGRDDFAQGSIVSTGTTAGTYAISPNGTGTATLTFTDGRTWALALTMVSSSKVYLLIASTAQFANGSGVAERQDSSAFSAPPSGTFAFHMHSISAVQGSTGSVGRFTVANGVVTSGNEDVNQAGVTSPLTLTAGLFNFPDATSGRGTGTFTDSSSVTSTFVYYVINANKIFFFSSVAGVQGIGQAEMQTGGPFSNASLSGSYVFGSRGDTLSSLGGVNTVGRVTADGNGNISAGAYDFVQDGTSFSNISLTGTYNLASSGRATVTLSPSNSGNVQQIFWMVSPSRAFLLTADPNKVEDGSLDLQTVSSFSTSTMNGQFAIVMDGFDTTDLVDRIGTLQWDGNGNLQFNELLNRSGGITIPPLLQGSYAVSSSGRATGTIDGFSSNLVFYLISGSDGYVLQDATQIDGIMSRQP